MIDKLAEHLRSGTVIFDGAVGTELYKKNFFLNTSYESLCLSSPKIVKEIHESYREAGAEVLTTNSYGANAVQLNKFLRGDKVSEINRAAVTLAREVAGKELMVAASVGPVDDSAVSGAVKLDPAAVLREQVEALIAAGPDFILFESLRGAGDLTRALAVMKDFPDFPVYVSEGD